MTECKKDVVTKMNLSWSVSDGVNNGKQLCQRGFSSRDEAMARLREVLSKIDQTDRIEQKDLSSTT